MDKFKDFPETPRTITNSEGEEYFCNVLDKIDQFNPNEIIAVARSGFSYAMWISQILKKPLGAYWPDSNRLIFGSETPPDRCVFVDDNILQGSTYLKTKNFMNTVFPDVEWKWAVLFSDWHTPENIRNEIIQGTRLPFFAEEPIWGSKKISKDYGVRYRDE